MMVDQGSMNPQFLLLTVQKGGDVKNQTDPIRVLHCQLSCLCCAPIAYHGPVISLKKGMRSIFSYFYQKVSVISFLERKGKKTTSAIFFHLSFHKVMWTLCITSIDLSRVWESQDNQVPFQFSVNRLSATHRVKKGKESPKQRHKQTSEFIYTNLSLAFAWPPVSLSC